MKPINMWIRTVYGFTYNYNFLDIVWVRINVMHNTRPIWPVQTAIVPPVPYSREIKVIDGND